MIKKIFGLLIPACTLFFALPKCATAQIYVFSFVEPYSSSLLQGSCETLAMSQKTYTEYYQFGVKCTAITPSPDPGCNNGAEWVSLTEFGAECDWYFPVQPGFSYAVNSSHTLWFPALLSGKNPPTPGGPYYDVEGYTTLGTASEPLSLPPGDWADPALTYLLDQWTIAMPYDIADPLPMPLSPSAVIATTHANFTAVDIEPRNTAAIQTQKVSFYSNLNDLRTISGQADDNLTWQTCATVEVFPCLQGQGTLDTNTGASVTYTAPATIDNSLNFMTGWNPTYDYVCVSETYTPANMICAPISLNQVSLTLNPAAASLQPGQQQVFTAYVNTSDSVSWGTWQDSSGDGTPGVPTTSGNVSEYTYHFTAPSSAGSYTLTANAVVYAGLNLPLSATAVITVGTSLKAQTITFGSVPAQVVNTPLTLAAKASSRLAVSYLTLTPTICTVSGSTTSMLAVGTCTIQALQWGNSAYATAPPVSQSFTVNSLGQTISFGTISTQTATQSIALSATASSGLLVSFTSAAPAVCSVSGSIASMLAAGTCTIQANQAGNTIYGAAPAVSQSFTVSGGTLQTISFAPISSPQNAGSQIALTASSSSGLPVTMAAITPSTCSVSGLGAYASLVASGTCTIQASQAGNATYQAASSISQTFSIIQQAQTISFGVVPQQYAGTTVGMTATASSGLPVTYTSSTPNVCTVSGLAGSVLLVAPGNCSVEADQVGSSIYSAAASVDQSFTVVGNNQTASNGSFAPTNVGSTSPATTLNFTFDTATTLGSVVVLTQGATGLDFADAGTGTCTAQTFYNVGDTCSVSVTFAPRLSGARYGAAVLKDTAENVINTGYMEGIGVGPQVAFLPGTQLQLGNSVETPISVAVDGSGNVYIADIRNNRVLKESFSAGSYTESTLPTSALLEPEGLALDAGGNIYIADAGNSRVLKETPSAGGYTETTVGVSSLSLPSGVAVDGSGNVYIADTRNHRVLEETPVDGNYVESTVADTASSGLLWPEGVAVDSSGKVYIADGWNSQYVLVETPSAGSYSTTLLGSGLYWPLGVAVDGDGNVYIADTSNNRIVEETPSVSTYVQSTLPINGLVDPEGVAVDAQGDVYIADTFNFRVLKDNLAGPPALTFAPTVVGSISSDSPQIVTVENVGNAALAFEVPTAGNNPSIAGDFTLNSNVASACALVNAGSQTAATLGSGQSCVLPISFTPTALGSRVGSLTLTDDSLNAAAPGYATHTIPLSGNGAQSQTINFTSPPSSVRYGVSPITLSAVATSGLPVTFSATGPATVSGNTLTITGTGTVVVTASQVGNTQFAAATPVSRTITVK